MVEIQVCDSRFRGSDHWHMCCAWAGSRRLGWPPVGRPGGRRRRVERAGSERFTQRVVVPPATAPGSYFQELRRPGDQASVWVPLRGLPYPNTLEHEPDDATRQCHASPDSSVLHGSIANPEDRDAFALDLAAGQRLAVHVECRPLGSPADLDISLIEPGGKTVTRLDTLPDGESPSRSKPRRGAAMSCSCASLTGEGGPEYVYRITSPCASRTSGWSPTPPAWRSPRVVSALALESHPDRFRRTSRAGAMRVPPAWRLVPRSSARAKRISSISITVADSVPKESTRSRSWRERAEGREQPPSPRPCLYRSLALGTRPAWRTLRAARGPARCPRP